MAVTFTLEFGPEVGTRAQLDEVRRVVGANTDDTMPAGMLAHLESETPRGFRVVDVWESEDDFARFYEEALEAAFDASGFRPLDGPPEAEPVVNLMLRQRAPSYEALMREISDAFVQGDLDVLDRHLHADFVDHDQVPGFEPTKEGTKQFATALASAFEGLTVELVQVVSAPGRVAVVQRFRGRHTGEFLGIPATGRTADVESLDCFTVDDEGLLTAHWGQFDQVGMLAQLGVPAQAAAPAEEQASETRA